MRLPDWTMLAIGAAFIAAPASAQTYDPNFPACLQTYGIDGGYIDCSFTSLDQCRASASGRAAQCLTNPYFAHAGREPPVGRRQRGSIREFIAPARISRLHLQFAAAFLTS